MKEQSNMENKQKVEKNLVAISQIIIFQLLIITIIKKIIVVSKYFYFLFDMATFIIYGVHSMICSYHYVKNNWFFLKKRKRKKKGH